jgi:hypothetical protein
MPLCPCCGTDLSERQIRRHLAIRQQALGAYLDAMNEAEAGPAPPNDLIPAPNNADPALDDADDNNDLELDDADLAPRDNSPALGEDQPGHWRGIHIADLIAREDEDEDVGENAYLSISHC